MNILPHKSWHVRTKANIARVRKDEAKAAEEEKERQRRIDLAEQEARIDLLRQKAKLNKTSVSSSELEDIFNTPSGSSTSLVDSGHVNLFQALEEGRDTVKKPNAEHEKEKKEEQEKYEKQIGYLTYLGQDTNESLKKQDWYEEVPDREKLKSDKTEVGLKFKSYHDPLNVIRRALPNERIELSNGTHRLTSSKYEPIMSQIVTINEKLDARKELKRIRKHSKSKKKSKKHKNKHKKKKSSSKKRKRETSSSDSDADSSSESEDEATKALKRQKLEILRQERLKREQIERAKADQLLSKIRGDPPPKPPKEPERPQVKQKYNSQFNPELARQNYDDRV